MTPLQFEIQYECLQPLANGARTPEPRSRPQNHPLNKIPRGVPRSGANRTFDSSTLPTHPPRADLEWKLTYVGSAESDAHDQVLDTVLVGPVAVGSYKFVFQADPPDISRIPQSDILGVTVLLLTCSYDDVEFIRVGYYVNNDYHDQFEELRENPPATVQIDKVVRNILEEKPRVTRFPCEFDTPSIPTRSGMEGDGGVAMGEEMENVQPGFGGGGFEEKIGFDQAATATQGFGFNAGHGPTEVQY
jgi:histone chaperone ASF1